MASYTIALGVTGNIHNWNLFDAFKATFFGAIGGAVTFGVGEIFNVASQAGKLTQIGTLIQKSVGDFGLAIVQAGTHAVAQGVLSVFQGEGFVKNAFGHWKKHRAEFPKILNAKEYVQSAKKFMHNSPKGTLIKTRSNGDILKYHPGTNTFGVMDAFGTPKTMFKPNDGIKYWKRQ